jgi:hypothetical protein
MNKTISAHGLSFSRVIPCGFLDGGKQVQVCNSNKRNSCFQPAAYSASFPYRGGTKEHTALVMSMKKARFSL